MEISAHVVVLAAGSGRRLKSPLPQALEPVLGKPMLHYALDAAGELTARSLSVVVGPQESLVRESCAGYPGLRFFRQEEPAGTARAVAAAGGFLREAGGTVLVLSADVVLLRGASLRRLLEAHAASGAACTLATTHLDDPSGYGRVLGRPGALEVREEADCDERELACRRVNAGAYCFEAPALLDALARVGNKNARGEYGLPDVVGILSRARRGVRVFPLRDPAEALGVNDLCERAQVEALLRERVNREWMLAGARLADPRTTVIDARSRLSAGCSIEGGVILVNSVVGAGAVVEAGSRVVDSELGAGALVRQGSYIEEASVGSGCVVGPYAHLRPGTRLAERARIGNFVEVKNSLIGEGSQASHLAYIGDAEVGRRVNIGCGFITCNFDGRKKNRTVIEDDAFVGSDSQAVAPVTLGARSFIATGTCVTEDVPPDAMAISRGRQLNKPGYAKKYRPSKP